MASAKYGLALAHRECKRLDHRQHRTHNAGRHHPRPTRHLRNRLVRPVPLEYSVSATQRAQAREQGRYLGGRPPCGYRLVDAGPHPNRAHAQWGRRLQKLDPDPTTAPHVMWMLAQRLTGRSIAGIARALNDGQVLCPSRADTDRNSHRAGHGWTVRTLATILANPRYTGRQVWNR